MGLQGFPGGSKVKASACNAGDLGSIPGLGRSPGEGWEDSLEKEMATHSSILAWRTPGTAEPGGLPSMGSHRVGHDWSNSGSCSGLVLAPQTKPQAQLRGPANLQALAESLRAPETTVCVLPQVGACPGPSHRLPQACAIQEHSPAIHGRGGPVAAAKARNTWRRQTSPPLEGRGGS